LGAGKKTGLPLMKSMRYVGKKAFPTTARRDFSTYPMETQDEYHWDLSFTGKLSILLAPMSHLPNIWISNICINCANIKNPVFSKNYYLDLTSLRFNRYSVPLQITNLTIIPKENTALGES
jgi:hypothetical protein